MLQRVEAISTVHRRLYQSKDVQQFDLAEFLHDIANDLVKASGRDDIELSLDLMPVKVPAQQASPFALMLNELLMNALKHAFPIGRPGCLLIEVRSNGDYLTVYIADDGVGMPESRNRAGFGNRLVKTLARQLQARDPLAARQSRDDRRNQIPLQEILCGAVEWISRCGF